MPAAALIASVAAAATLQESWTTLSAAPEDPTPLRAAPRPAPADPAIAAALAEWTRLRQSDRLPFADYARFLLAHPGWPGEAAMRKAAEGALRPDMTDGAQPVDIIRLFGRFPPASGTARVRHAEALAASGRRAEADAAARAAWTGGALSPTDEARVAADFAGALGQAEQDLRMERLLWDRATGSAQRQLALVSVARQPLYEARLAMQLRRADAATLGDGLRPVADRDAGFQRDRALWLRDTAQSPAARTYLARPVPYDRPPFDAEKWLETMLAMARAAQADDQPALAYAIAARADQAFAPGTNVRERTAGERDDYTSLTWLAGTTALKKLARPVDAAAMFARYQAAAKSPQSQTKGQYWAGRAADAAGRAQDAGRWFGNAATHFDQFYGQLAAERLGRPLPVPPPAAVAQVSPAAQAVFDANELVRAARWLGLNGSWQDQTQFVRAIAAVVRSDSDHLLATRLAQEIARPDLGVMVARAARMDGSSDYVRSSFPEVRVPGPLAPRWVMIHSIMRQESQFDREATSIAGARGLMQLMPATAKQTAGRLGMAWEPGRLVTDPSYNMTLGATYFGQMLDRFGGNHVLAVAAYNAGPGNVAKFIAANGDPRQPGVDVVDWIEAIPLQETRGYVQRVLENAVVYDLLNPERARVAQGGNRLSRYLGKTSAG